MFDKKSALFIISFLIVAFGQPAYSGFLAIFSAIFGFAIFFKFLLEQPTRKKRFFWGAFWFSLIQIVNLFWLTSHPYLYIYIVLAFLSTLFGLQFALLSLFITQENVKKLSKIFALSAFWVLMEWSRLFIFSGHSWNPLGIALVSSVYSLQIATLFGIFGLSFLVMLTNLLAIRAWEYRLSLKPLLLCLSIAAAPYLFGFMHIQYHEKKMAKEEQKEFSTLLVQTAFPVEEAMDFHSQKDFLQFVINEWKEILTITGKHIGKSVNLIVLPEFVVPYGTYTFVYPYDEIVQYIEEIYGLDSLEKMPKLALPLANETDKGWMVNNAYLTQTLANLFDAYVIAGLEDAEDIDGQREYFSAALYFEPESKRRTSLFEPNRYSKRILVPMGEYIPFKFCRNLAADYGICGSFTPGKGRVAWNCDGVPIAVSICYEETFGDLMRDNCSGSAKLLVNITSDAWFPHSSLIRQHLEHARLRTLENGVPLIRACNTGVTCVVDALGRDVAVLGENDNEREDLQAALYAKVPTYTYQTLYSRFGDNLILILSLILTLFIFI